MGPRKLLLITSNHTGMGHRSICSALAEKFMEKSDTEVTIIDGFELIGRTDLGRIYGSVTRTAKEFYRIFWDITTAASRLLEQINYQMTKDIFSHYLAKLKPDYIIALHPAFNESVVRIMRRIGLDAVHIAMVADLVTIHPLWASRHSDCVICPTVEAKEACKRMGVCEQRLKVLGFPVRNVFCEHNDAHTDRDRLVCLIMSGGEGVGNLGKIAGTLLESYDCIVKVITGRNTALKRELEAGLARKFPGKAIVYGCVDNVHEIMHSCDLVITRGSPNAMMEAVMCNIPLLITGALPGQEQGNPTYAEKYGLGMSCSGINGLRKTMDEFLRDGGKKLHEIKLSQQAYRNPLITGQIVDFILDTDWKHRQNPKMPYFVDMPGLL